MIATSPEALHERWVEGVNRGDLKGLATLYEPAAAFVVRPAEVVAGLPAVREALAGLLALKPRATLTVKTVVRAGDLALLLSTWRLTGTDRTGAPVELSGQTADVARRQADGSWRFAIDNPWGDAAVGA
jgi:uncharacterized protein (TIGR02246 family)